MATGKDTQHSIFNQSVNRLLGWVVVALDSVACQCHASRFATPEAIMAQIWPGKAPSLSPATDAVPSQMDTSYKSLYAKQTRQLDVIW